MVKAGTDPEIVCNIAMPEDVRLETLAAHRPDSLVDDPELEAITGFASKLCDTPIALVSLVEERRQRFLSREGLEATETPRSASFCQFAMVGDGIMEVRDATADPRFADNILVTGDPNIRFYAGAPLVSEEGAALGALCVISDVPRPQGLTPFQREGLTVLAQAVMRRMKDRRAHADWKESERRFEALANVIPQMAWSTLGNGAADYFNARWYEFTGAGPSDHLEFGWLSAIHPEDQERCSTVWAESVRTAKPYDIEYRLRRHDGEFRWTLVRGVPILGEDGKVLRWFGTNTDIHEHQQLSESRDVLSRELSHRIKNIFSVISGLIGLESRAHPGMETVADNLRERIVSLGRAHDFVRPHGTGEAAATLHGVLGELFAPYVDGEGNRVRVDGEDVTLNDKAVTPIALLFHEMATNAAKYGALSREGGQVTLHIRRSGDDMLFDWTESGGPKVAGEQAMTGFGSQLVDMSVRRQLGGTHKVDWAPNGLKVTITVPASALS